MLGSSSVATGRGGLPDSCLTVNTTQLHTNAHGANYSKAHPYATGVATGKQPRLTTWCPSNRGAHGAMGWCHPANTATQNGEQS